MGLNKVVSDSIRAIRTYQMLSQGDLAKKARVSQSTIAQIECGKKLPSLQTIEKISKALKVKPFELLMEHVLELRHLEPANKAKE